MGSREYRDASRVWLRHFNLAHGTGSDGCPNSGALRAHSPTRWPSGYTSARSPTGEFHFSASERLATFTDR